MLENASALHEPGRDRVLYRSFREQSGSFRSAPTMALRNARGRRADRPAALTPSFRLRRERHSHSTTRPRSGSLLALTSAARAEPRSESPMTRRYAQDSLPEHYTTRRSLKRSSTREDRVSSRARARQSAHGVEPGIYPLDWRHGLLDAPHGHGLELEERDPGHRALNDRLSGVGFRRSRSRPRCRHVSSAPKLKWRGPLREN